MIQLVATAIITLSSVFLLGYWFRYTCLLILAARATQDCDCEIAMAKPLSRQEVRSMLRERTVTNLHRLCAVAVGNGLSFPEVQSLLREPAVTDLDRLRESLDRDYRVVLHVLDRAAQGMGKAAFERHMLAINYHFLGTWYPVKRRHSAQGARLILEEMSWVVAYFAESVGV